MDKKEKLKFNVLAIVCIVIFCIAIAPITLQNDTFYTIKIGEEILQNGIHMEKDPFSFHDIPYTYPHWLYDVGIYLVYKVGGMLGIYVSTIILSCILGVTVYITNKKIVKNDLISFALTLCVMCVLRSFVAARAQLVTFILFALAIFFIEKFLETKKKRYAVGLILIPTIIANVHLAVWPFYFILFLPYIAEYLLVRIVQSCFWDKISIWIVKVRIKRAKKEEVIQKLKEDLEKQKRNLEKTKSNLQRRQEQPYKIRMERQDAVKGLILIMIICAFTGFLTPLGDTPYTYLVKTMQGTTTKSINEHLPMVLIQSKFMLAILAIVLGILVFTDTKIRLKDFFMLGGLIILALMSRRQLSLLTLIGVYSVNRMICDLIDKYDPKGTYQFGKLMISLSGQALTLLLVVLFSIIVYRPQARNEFIDQRSYPMAATQYIKDNLDYKNIRLYNEYNYGSYLLYQGVPVFIDSRADLYTPEFNGDKEKNIFTDFLNVSGINVYYEDIFKKYQITHLLIPNNAKINLFLPRDNNYKQLYKDEHFIIYERLTKE